MPYTVAMLELMPSRIYLVPVLARRLLGSLNEFEQPCSKVWRSTCKYIHVQLHLWNLSVVLVLCFASGYSPNLEVASRVGVAESDVKTQTPTQVQHQSDNSAAVARDNLRRPEALRLFSGISCVGGQVVDCTGVTLCAIKC